MNLPSINPKLLSFTPRVELNLMRFGTTTDAERSLEERIAAIEERNQRVEIDKAWEGSWTRKGLIIVFTFFSIGGYMWVIGVEQPLLNAVIPSLGFTLSTLTLPFFKDQWKKYYKS